MYKLRSLCLGLALAAVVTLSAQGAQVDCDTIYCFSTGDFAPEEDLAGICITSLPQAQTGTVLLGNRVIRTGDILTAQQVAQMTFSPLTTQEDAQASISYLPIFANRVDKEAVMTISIRGKADHSPVAQDSTLETYKNLPRDGQLKVEDPEGAPLVYTLVRQPKRGQVTIHADGSFTYTPKKNKVGVDSFTYTATDPAGNVSREATVTLEILKPTDSRQYTDTVGRECRFAAEWMRNTGLFVGEQIGGEACFYPEKTVTRGEFLTMLVEALEIPDREAAYSAIPQDTPGWLKPYLAAAMRAGLTAGLPEEAGGSFAADRAITGAEAAVLLQNALELTVEETLLETAATDVPAWAQVSLTAMSAHGIDLAATDVLTRGQVAQVLYEASSLAATAPGMAAIRLQQ